MVFRRETATPELAREVSPVLLEHFNEVHPHAASGFEFKPNMELYFSAESNDLFHLFTVRNAGELVGYAAYFLRKNLHGNRIEAVCDAIFIRKAYRLGLLGYRFIKWCDLQLKEAGAACVVYAVSARKDYSLILKRLGYQLDESIYSRGFA